MRSIRARRSAIITAVAGTVFIAAGAFWLSFTSLAARAARSGIGAGQAWAWPGHAPPGIHGRCLREPQPFQ